MTARCVKGSRPRRRQRGPDGRLLNGCVAARCGDGVVQAGVEDRDDANQVESDACLTTCACCGDGVQRLDLGVEDQGYEACDDGNNIETDACLSACTVALRRRRSARGR